MPILQFGSMLHNSLPIVKKIHMQNISHIPIRIDWIVYDVIDEKTENPKLIELISVIDNNPFDSFINDIIITENTDDLMSQTTVSTSKKSHS